MLQNYYQGGETYEIFSSQGAAANVNWKLKGCVKKQYERDIKGFCYGCDGMGKLIFPKEVGNRKKVGLVQNFLVIQANVGTGINIEVLLQDLESNHRRVFLSQNKVQKLTALHASLPFHPQRQVWNNIVIDLRSLVSIQLYNIID